MVLTYWGSIVGTKQIIFAPTPNDGFLKYRQLGRKIRNKFKSLNSNKIHLGCGAYITPWLQFAYNDGYKEKDLDNIIVRLNKDLDDPKCTVMSEIAVYHFKKYKKQRVVTYSPLFKPFVEIIGQIVKKGKWINLHIEPVDSGTGVSYENSAFGGIAKLYEKYPNMKLILSHSGMTSAENLRRLLIKYPKLMVTFKLVGVNHWKHLEPINNNEFKLYEDWATLFEEMPTRFMLGSDTKLGRNYEKGVKKYNRRINRYRDILGTLKPKVAKMIAYENAKRIFNLKD